MNINALLKKTRKPSEDHVLNQLSRDLVYRKEREWPLIEEAEWMQFKTDAPIKYLTLMGYKNVWNPFDLTWLHRYFPCVQPLLEKFRGNLVIAGGFYTSRYCNDVDFFFHSCDERRASEILKEAVRHIVESTNHKVIIEHSMHIVNVNVFVPDPHINDPDNIRVEKYQFILRLYPRLDMILGGFDLGCSMVAYDGEKILATPMGAYTLINYRIIIDISRRSTTFAKRLQKYKQRGFEVVFPGFHKDTQFVKEVPGAKEAIERIKTIAAQYHLEFRAYDFSYDYDGHADPPRRLSIDHAFEGPNEVRFRDFVITSSRSYNRFLPPKLSKDSPQLHEQLSDYGPGSSLYIEESNLSALMNLRDEGVMVSKVITAKAFEQVWKEVIEEPEILYKKNYAAIEEADCSLANCDRETIRKRVRRFGAFLDPKHHVGILTGAQWLREIEAFRDRRILEVVPKLIGIQWITENPGRQWTSSVNPQIIAARQFYGKFYTPVYVILPPETETCVRCVLKNFGCNKDVRNLIIKLIAFV